MVFENKEERDKSKLLSPGRQDSSALAKEGTSQLKNLRLVVKSTMKATAARKKLLDQDSEDDSLNNSFQKQAQLSFRDLRPQELEDHREDVTGCPPAKGRPLRQPSNGGMEAMRASLAQVTEAAETHKQALEEDELTFSDLQQRQRPMDANNLKEFLEDTSEHPEEGTHARASSVRLSTSRRLRSSLEDARRIRKELEKEEGKEEKEQPLDMDANATHTRTSALPTTNIPNGDGEKSRSERGTKPRPSREKNRSKSMTVSSHKAPSTAATFQTKPLPPRATTAPSRIQETPATDTTAANGSAGASRTKASKDKRWSTFTRDRSKDRRVLIKDTSTKEETNSGRKRTLMPKSKSMYSATGTATFTSQIPRRSRSRRSRTSLKPNTDLLGESTTKVRPRRTSSTALLMTDESKGYMADESSRFAIEDESARQTASPKIITRIEEIQANSKGGQKSARKHRSGSRRPRRSSPSNQMEASNASSKIPSSSDRRKPPRSTSTRRSKSNDGMLMDNKSSRRSSQRPVRRNKSAPSVVEPLQLVLDESSNQVRCELATFSPVKTDHSVVETTKTMDNSNSSLNNSSRNSPEQIDDRSSRGSRSKADVSSRGNRSIDDRSSRGSRSTGNGCTRDRSSRGTRSTGDASTRMDDRSSRGSRSTEDASSRGLPVPAAAVTSGRRTSSCHTPGYGLPESLRTMMAPPTPTTAQPSPRRGGYSSGTARAARERVLSKTKRMPTLSTTLTPQQLLQESCRF